MTLRILILPGDLDDLRKHNLLAALDNLAQTLISGGEIAAFALPPLDQLAKYYRRLGMLARGYEKNPTKPEEQLAVIKQWEDEVRNLAKLIRG